jgi:HEAT repeat protein
VAEWVQDLSAKDGEVRRRAAKALAELKPQDAAAISALAAQLGDREAGVDTYAVDALAAIGAKAVPALVGVLGASEDAQARMWAAAALGQMGPAAADGVPALAKALGDGKGGVRYNAAKALGRIGPGAKVAAPALVRALKDEEVETRSEAAEALARIHAEPRAVVPALRGALKDQETRVVLAAAWTWGRPPPTWPNCLRRCRTPRPTS